MPRPRITVETESPVGSLLRNVTQMLGIIPTEDLEAHVKQCASQLASTDALGALLDPTGYAELLESGERDFLEWQLSVARMYLEIRRGMDRMEAARRAHRQ